MPQVCTSNVLFKLIDTIVDEFEKAKVMLKPAVKKKKEAFGYH